MGLWGELDGARHIVSYAGSVYRMVESQERAATMQLVDTLPEQELLEVLLEDSKPPVPPGTEHLPYLLRTPFRYPPLRHGSRFGTRAGRGIFYASLGLRTALAETAYYRFVFLSGMAMSPQDPVQSPMTSFRARAAAERAVRLDRPPFERYRDRISARTRYGDAQALGVEMRAAGVEVVIYYSARDPRPDCRNIAVFEPAALNGSLSARRSWSCTASDARVVFIDGHTGEGHEFTRRQFEVDGELPAPAA